MKEIIQIFERTLALPEVSVPSVDDGGTDKIEQRTGQTSPYIEIAGVSYTEEMIKSFELIYGQELLPKLIFTIFDNASLITNNLIDEIETIKVFMRSDNIDFKSILAEFLVTDMEAIGDNRYTFQCDLFVKGIDDKEIKTYPGTSFDVCQEIAKELELGFASNVTNSNDDQNWLKLSQSNEEFINELELRSWIDDDSSIVIWIDPYYNINYYNIHKTYSAEATEFDKMAETNTQIDLAQEKDNPIVDFYLSNHTRKTGTPNWINSYKVIDRRGEIEKEIGYERTIRTQDLDDEQYYEYNIQSEIEGETLDRSGKNLRINYIGFTSVNHHRNYEHARIQNTVNNTIYQSKGLRLNLSSINAVIYNGMRVPVVLMIQDENYTDLAGDDARSGINEALTADYIIYQTSYKWNKGSYKTMVDCLTVRT